LRVWRCSRRGSGECAQSQAQRRIRAHAPGLEAARRIQRSLLPQALPDIPAYSLAFRSDACYEVGGDYLDIVEQPDAVY